MKITIRIRTNEQRIAIKQTNWQGITGQQQNKPVFIGWDQLDLPTLRFMAAIHRLKALKLFNSSKTIR
jgi:hypothetical protein